MVVLVVLTPDDIHAEGHLMLALQNVDVVSHLIRGDVEASQSSGTTTDREAAIAHCQLQIVVGALIDVLNAEHRGVDTDSVWASVVATSTEGEVQRVHNRRTNNVTIAKRHALRLLVITRGCGHQDVFRVEERREIIDVNEVASIEVMFWTDRPIAATDILLLV